MLIFKFFVAYIPFVDSCRLESFPKSSIFISLNDGFAVFEYENSRSKINKRHHYNG